MKRIRLWTARRLAVGSTQGTASSKLPAPTETPTVAMVDLSVRLRTDFGGASKVCFNIEILLKTLIDFGGAFRRGCNRETSRSRAAVRCPSGIAILAVRGARVLPRAAARKNTSGRSENSLLC